MKTVRSATKKPKQVRRATDRKPKAVEASSPEKKPRLAPMKITATHVAMSRQQKRDIRDISQRVFAPYKPAPGVVPTGKAVMANDAAIKKAATWAAGSMDEQIIFAGGWAGACGSGGYGAFAEGQAFLGYAYLSELSQRPEYRIISETIASEMFRKGMIFKASGKAGDKAERLKQLDKEFERLKVIENFITVTEQDGFLGRAHLFLDFGKAKKNDPELKSPVGNGINEITRAKGQLKLQRLQPVEATWSYPTNYNANNPLEGDWYTPEMWFALGTEVHVSRFLTFIGRPVLDILKPAYAFGGLSMSQMAKPYVDNWLRTRQSVSDLVHSFTVWCLATNMGETLTPGGEQLFNRAAIFNNLRDNKGLMITDKDTEEVTNISTPLGGLDALQSQSMEQMCFVAHSPKIKLLGLDPAGLNASSEGELRSYYDYVVAYRKRFADPNMQVVFRFAQINLWGAVDPDISYEYGDLWEMDEKQRAEIRKIDADTDAVLEGVGAIDSEEIRERVASDKGSPHASLDLSKVIEKPEDEEDVGGLGIGQGGGLGKSPNEFEGKIQ